MATDVNSWAATSLLVSPVDTRAATRRSAAVGRSVLRGRGRARPALRARSRAGPAPSPLNSPSARSAEPRVVASAEATQDRPLREQDLASSHARRSPRSPCGRRRGGPAHRRVAGASQHQPVAQRPRPGPRGGNCSPALAQQVGGGRRLALLARLDQDGHRLGNDGAGRRSGRRPRRPAGAFRGRQVGTTSTLQAARGGRRPRGRGPPTPPAAGRPRAIWRRHDIAGGVERGPSGSAPPAQEGALHRAVTRQ